MCPTEILTIAKRLRDALCLTALTGLMLLLTVGRTVAGDVQFGPQHVITTSVAAVFSVYAGDLHGDGDLDVLLPSRNDDKIAWYQKLPTILPLKPPGVPEAILVPFAIIAEPTLARPGQAVTYTYRWSSDDGEEVIHENRADLFDCLNDPSILRDNQSWTVTVTPFLAGLVGPSIPEHLRILAPPADVAQWMLYK